MSTFIFQERYCDTEILSLQSITSSTHDISILLGPISISPRYLVVIFIMNARKMQALVQSRKTGAGSRHEKLIFPSSIQCMRIDTLNLNKQPYDIVIFIVMVIEIFPASFNDPLLRRRNRDIGILVRRRGLLCFLLRV